MSNTESPVWSELTEPRAVAAALVEIYRQRGGGRYDEVVTQTDHALQCGSLAMADRAIDQVIAAAFLHDIGHLLANDAGAPVDRRHEDVAADFLLAWFDEDVLGPIRLHVAAKRYLCAVEPEYHDILSPGSIRSLELQGGPMTSDEVAAFESKPHYETAVRLRRWDDGAKTLGAPTATLNAFEQLLGDILIRR